MINFFHERLQRLYFDPRELPFSMFSSLFSFAARHSSVLQLISDAPGYRYEAARQGQARLLRHILLSHSIDINAADESGYTLLHYACLGGHLEMVQMLVKEFHAEVKTATPQGDRPIHLAAQNGHQDIIKFLVNDGQENVSQPQHNSQQNTPLHEAARNGHLAAAEMLLELGAPLNSVNRLGDTPLHLAAAEGHLEVVQFIIKKVNTATNEMAWKRSILQSRNALSYTPLHTAAYRGQEQVVQALIQQGNIPVDILTSPETLLTSLHLAAFGGHVLACRTLCKLGANIRAQDKAKNTPLHFAAASGNGLVVEELVLKGASINTANANGETPLHRAAVMRLGNIVQVLLNLGADTSIQDQRGYTPLALAITSGDIDFIKVFLMQEAQFTRPLSPADIFQLATIAITFTRDVDVLHVLLLRAGVRANKLRDSLGNSLLHVAASTGNIPFLVSLIKDYSVNVNTTNNIGESPLHSAVRAAQMAAVIILAYYKADLNFANQEGETPVTLATHKAQLNNQNQSAKTFHRHVEDQPVAIHSFNQRWIASYLENYNNAAVRATHEPLEKAIINQYVLSQAEASSPSPLPIISLENRTVTSQDTANYPPSLLLASSAATTNNPFSTITNLIRTLFSFSPTASYGEAASASPAGASTPTAPAHDTQLNCHVVPPTEDTSISLHCQNARMDITIFPKTEPPTEAISQDIYNLEDCHAVEYAGKPSLYCEGKKTNAIIKANLPQPLPVDSIITLAAFFWSVVKRPQKEEVRTLLVREKPFYQQIKVLKEKLHNFKEKTLKFNEKASPLSAWALENIDNFERDIATLEKQFPAKGVTKQELYALKQGADHFIQEMTKDFTNKTLTVTTQDKTPPAFTPHYEQQLYPLNEGRFAPTLPSQSSLAPPTVPLTRMIGK